MASNATVQAPDYADESDSQATLAQQVIASIQTDLSQDRLVWPSVPAIALTAQNLIRHPDANPAEVAHVVTMDPALSTRLLRMANTDEFGASLACTTLEQALQRLGARASHHVAELFVAGQIYNVGNRRRIQPHLGRLWRHSTRVASICRQIAATCPALQPSIAMLAGLLHDIGVLPILVFAEDVPRLLSNRESLNILIETVHCEVSGAVLQAWGLPDEIATAARLHEDIYRDEESAPSYTDVVTVANLLAHRGLEHRHTNVDLSTVPAADKLEIPQSKIESLLESAKQNEATYWDH